MSIEGDDDDFEQVVFTGEVRSRGGDKVSTTVNGELTADFLPRLSAFFELSVRVLKRRYSRVDDFYYYPPHFENAIWLSSNKNPCCFELD